LPFRLADASPGVFRESFPNGASAAVEIDDVGTAGDRSGIPGSSRNCVLPRGSLDWVWAKALPQKAPCPQVGAHNGNLFRRDCTGSDKSPEAPSGGKRILDENELANSITDHRQD
jgi:hypothetical protein